MGLTKTIYHKFHQVLKDECKANGITVSKFWNFVNNDEYYRVSHIGNRMKHLFRNLMATYDIAELLEIDASTLVKYSDEPEKEAKTNTKKVLPLFGV